VDLDYPTVNIVSSVPDRSLADFNWAVTCITGGKSIEDTISKLLEVSPNAKKRY
jgi:hypothetical protein